MVYVRTWSLYIFNIEYWPGDDAKLYKVKSNRGKFRVDSVSYEVIFPSKLMIDHKEKQQYHTYNSSRTRFGSPWEPNLVKLLGSCPPKPLAHACFLEPWFGHGSTWFEGWRWRKVYNCCGLKPYNYISCDQKASKIHIPNALQNSALCTTTWSI